MTTPQSLVDEAALERYLDEHVPGHGELAVERHQAGHSNETFFVTRGEDRWVLRRPPLGAFLPSAHDVGREYRVLAALGSTNVRVPRVVTMCEDESLIGAPFYLMQRVDGFVLRSEIPEEFPFEDRPVIGTELVDALVELHEVDPEACGLGAFGKPAGYLERQLRRWSGQLELTVPFTRPLPELEEVGRWLADNLPRQQATSIVHGDYKLDNVMYAPGPARLVAILDWEMSTLGDPLADVGWMASFWRPYEDEADTALARLPRVNDVPGFPSADEMLDRYAGATGRDLSDLRWYEVLALWKLAILLEGSYARHLAGMTDDPFFEHMREGVPALAARAARVTR